MSDTEAGSGDSAGFGAEDFAILEGMAAADSRPTGDLADRVDALWAKAERLVDELGAGLFGEAGHTAAVWPDNDDDERPPFIWARLKRAGNERYATHIGLFLSPGSCNLSIDLEKDPLDAGDSAETLDQVIEFYRSDFASTLTETERMDIRVWTDTRNVVGTVGFASIDFDRFLADNRDPGHPWPKTGYVLSVADVERFAPRWVEEYRERAAPLVPIYDAMIRSFGPARSVGPDDATPPRGIVNSS